MTISKNLEIYRTGTARGALLPRVMRYLDLSEVDQNKLLTALWIDQKSEILKGDFIRLDPTNASEYDFGKTPDEVLSLYEELAAAGL